LAGGKIFPAHGAISNSTGIQTYNGWIDRRMKELGIRMVNPVKKNTQAAVHPNPLEGNEINITAEANRCLWTGSCWMLVEEQ
jgi:hypothetical protein